MAWVFAGDWACARAAFADAFGLAERTTDPQLLTWTAIGALYTGDVATSRRGIERALELARRQGAMGDVAFGQPIMAYLHLVAGRFAIARTGAAEGLALALATGEDGAAAHCRALLAWVAAVRGDEDEPPAAPHVLALEATQRAQALRDLADGRHDAALDRLASVFEAPGAHPARRLFAVGDLVEAAIGAARPEAAEAPLAALRAWADATGSPWGAAIVAGAELQLGDETAYERALAAHERIALPFDRGRLELKLGERLRRAKQRTEARRHLRAAIEAFARTGAEPWKRRAAAELRATGETARTRDPSTLDDLTPQELQIARMVAEGATNRDVAGRLFLSPRTVDYHLRKVFQKLSVNSRTQLAGLDW
jgi:DNA-binding CsgD family transcriptional regulator